MDSLKQLIEKRDALEKEIAILKQNIKLTETNGTTFLIFSLFVEGYEKGLVDNEGFPRADLDFGKLSDYRLTKKRCNGIVLTHFNGKKSCKMIIRS